MIPSGIEVVGHVHEAPWFDGLCRESPNWVSKFRTSNQISPPIPPKGGTRHHRPRLQCSPDSAILGPPYPSLLPAPVALGRAKGPCGKEKVEGAARTGGRASSKKCWCFAWVSGKKVQAFHPDPKFGPSAGLGAVVTRHGSAPWVLRQAQDLEQRRRASRMACRMAEAECPAASGLEGSPARRETSGERRRRGRSPGPPGHL
jgi:hypothetical protein